jgi:hypothetical protein
MEIYSTRLVSGSVSSSCGKIGGPDDMVHCSAPDVGVEPELAKMYFSQLILGLVSQLSSFKEILSRHGVDTLISGAHTFQGNLSSRSEARKFAFGIKR